jgi:acetyltransferase-like isoleucine patch superfamily enzyme
LTSFVSKTLKHFARSLVFRVRYFGKQISIGRGTKISRRGTLRLYGGGSIKVGRNCHIMDYAMIQSYGGNVEIGDDCSVNPFCVLYGHGGLKIGKGVRIASHTVMIPANHGFEDLDTPIWRQAETRRGIVIEDDVWIGSGCTILDGVRIGRGCIIGAGAVVTASLPEFSIAVGVPARVVRDRRASPNVVGAD